MGATEISAGGTKKLFQGGGLQNKTQGGGLFSKLRVWVGKGLKKISLPQMPVWKKNLWKIKNIYKFGVFLTFFIGQGGGSPGKCQFFSIWGINFCLREGD